MYKLVFHPGWDKYFVKLNPDVQDRIWKKIKKIKQGIKCRRLHESKYFSCEVGQCRVTYESDEINKVRTIHFAGKHKDYDKWCGIRK